MRRLRPQQVQPLLPANFLLLLCAIKTGRGGGVWGRGRGQVGVVDPPPSCTPQNQHRGPNCSSPFTKKHKNRFCTYILALYTLCFVFFFVYHCKSQKHRKIKCFIITGHSSFSLSLSFFLLSSSFFFFFFFYCLAKSWSLVETGALCLPSLSAVFDAAAPLFVFLLLSFPPPPLNASRLPSPASVEGLLHFFSSSSASSSSCVCFS